MTTADIKAQFPVLLGSSVLEEYLLARYIYEEECEEDCHYLFEELNIDSPSLDIDMLTEAIPAKFKDGKNWARIEKRKQTKELYQSLEFTTGETANISTDSICRIFSPKIELFKNNFLFVVITDSTDSKVVYSGLRID